LDRRTNKFGGSKRASRVYRCRPNEEEQLTRTACIDYNIITGWTQDDYWAYISC